MYAELGVSDVLTTEDAIACYRSITGACSFGVRDFVEKTGADITKSYTVAEIIEMTAGRYGHDIFAAFFAAEV